MVNKTALVLVADGTEEMEAVITIDVLVRASIKVTVASIKPEASGAEKEEAVTCSRGVRLVPDTHLSKLSLDSDHFDALVIPGGAPGAKAMAESPLVKQWVRAYFQPQQQQSRLVAAICAGPTVLQAAEVGQGWAITSHPSVKDQLAEYYRYKEGPSVVVSSDAGGEEEKSVAKGKLITSRGPGTAFAFALTIAERLVGKEVVDKIRGPMMMMHD
ncbi:hypothetical protein DFQ26_005592 [Actinomortierella ambigua]|nr:hypothetical protein DFQ26_005592 [Actinomortierella ambigua]